MDRGEAIKILKDYKIFDSGGMSIKEIDECKKHNEALDLAIRALEREIEYGQMVVDYTKGEALESGNWEYTNTPTSDCISRQQAVEAIEDVDWYHVNSKGELVHGSTSEEESWYRADEVYKAIESLPPVEPERLTGEWVFNPKDAIDLMFTLPKCSKCGFESADCGNFCSNCGAYMKGGTENEWARNCKVVGIIKN